MLLIWSKGLFGACGTYSPQPIREYEEKNFGRSRMPRIYYPSKFDLTPVDFLLVRRLSVFLRLCAE